ncbi:MAG: sugar phosphate isomerase/epimerase family protein [Suipraeoptans sp.]
MSIKFGVCEFCMPCDGPLAIKMAHDAGFEGIQLGDLGGVSKSYPFSNRYVQDEYMQVSTDMNVNLQAMHLQSLFNSRFMLDIPTSENGKLAREALRSAAISCRQMNIPVIMVTATCVANQEQYDNLCAALKFGLQVCAENGVHLVMENDFTPNQFLNLRERVGEELKLCFDMMNPTVYGIGEPYKLIEEVGVQVIDHFHAKDCVENVHGYFSKYTTPYRLIGEGKSGFHKCAQVINSTDYDGWIMSETFYYSPDFRGRDFVELASRDVATLRNTFSNRRKA